MGLFESNVPIDNITVMVQKEGWQTACRWDRALKDTALSLAVQYYAEPYIWGKCSTELLFIPRPNVGSAVIRLTRQKEMPVQVADPKLMFRLIRASFNQRRKTLQNGLNNAPDISFTKEQIVAAIESLGVPATIRGEHWIYSSLRSWQIILPKIVDSTEYGMAAQSQSYHMP